ncbi:MAG: hypothetical protein PHC51_08135 [bacterium]|nr:hypothetical protein [bacterium]
MFDLISTIIFAFVPCCGVGIYRALYTDNIRRLISLTVVGELFVFSLIGIFFDSGQLVFTAAAFGALLFISVAVMAQIHWSITVAALIVLMVDASMLTGSLGLLVHGVLIVTLLVPMILSVVRPTSLLLGKCSELALALGYITQVLVWAMFFGVAVVYGRDLGLKPYELGAVTYVGGCLLMSVMTVIVVYGVYALRRAVAMDITLRQPFVEALSGLRGNESAASTLDRLEGIPVGFFNRIYEGELRRLEELREPIAYTSQNCKVLAVSLASDRNDEAYYCPRWESLAVVEIRKAEILLSQITIDVPGQVELHEAVLDLKIALSSRLMRLLRWRLHCAWNDSADLFKAAHGDGLDDKQKRLVTDVLEMLKKSEEQIAVSGAKFRDNTVSDITGIRQEYENLAKTFVEESNRNDGSTVVAESVVI